MSNDSTEMPKEFRILVEFLKTYGELIKIIGQIEKETGKPIDEIYREILKPEIVNKVTSKIPMELFAKLILTLVRISSLPVNRLNQLPPEEKIRVGEQLIEYTMELEKIIHEINEVTKKHDENNKQSEYLVPETSHI